MSAIISSTIDKLANIVDHVKEHELLSIEETLIAILILNYAKEHQIDILEQLRVEIANANKYAIRRRNDD